MSGAQSYQRDGVRLIVFPKSAHTSLANMFGTTTGGIPERGTWAGRTRNLGFQPIMVATFFRHPLPRLVSAWHSLLHDERHYDPLLEQGFAANCTFAAFCEHLLTIRDQDLNQHLRSQQLMLQDALSMIDEPVALPIWVGRVETLADDWHDLLNLTGLDASHIPAMFNARGDTGPWTRHYTPDLADAMIARYDYDLRIWQKRGCTSYGSPWVL